MAKFKNVAVLLTAAEAARQWAMNNPDKAETYIDQATGFIDKRTQGKYHSRIDSLSNAAKKNLTGRDTVRGSTAAGDGAPHGRGATGDAGSAGARRPFPDARA